MTVIQELKKLSNQLFINGEFRTSVATDGIEAINPATEEIIGHMPFTTAAEVEEAIEIANQSQKAWNKVNALARAELMHKIATNMREARGVLGEMLTREMGKPYKETTDEVDWSATAVDYYAEVARHDYGKVVGPAVDN